MRSRTIWGHRIGRSPIYATLAGAMLGCLPSWPAEAQSTPVATAPTDFVIPAGDLADALERFSTITGIQLAYQPELLAGKKVKALSGRMTWQDALNRLLEGSDLEYQQISAGTIAIRKSEGGGKSHAGPTARSTQASMSTTNDKKPVTEIEGVTVTGTRIRGGSTPSPVLTIGAENIREEGFADLGEAVRSLSQNFRGGQNPEVPSGNLLGAGIQNQNVTGGSSLNLRGLGPDATLTLLDGRRLSYSGISQAIDISMIPVEAVDRIEIVPDGASAIYGSDAVGGVGNVILRRNFEGVTVGTRYGAATDGGLATREYTATAGTTWSSGGVLATFMKASNAPIYADERDYTHYLASPTTIYPDSDLKSGLISLHQSLGDSVEFSLDALRTTKDLSNSFFLSNLPQYYRIFPKTTTTWVSPGVTFLLPHDWTVSLAATWGKDKSAFREASVNIPTGTSTLLYNYCFCNDLKTYEIGAEGPLFTLPGGDARLAVGAGYRTNEFRQAVTVGAGLFDLHGNDRSRFAYAEFNLPVIGPESGITGVSRFVITAAARSEDYDSFGRVTTPQLGVIYGPSDDFSLKGSWGKSFKAPTLYQSYNSVTGLLYPAVTFGATGYPADAAALYLQGGNPSLKPERARTWSASLAFHPEAIPNLEAELTGFDIDYTNRVVFPFTNPFQGLSNPTYASFVDYSPTAQALANAVSSADSFFNATGAAYDPNKVVAILYGRFANVNSQHIKGADLSGSYRFDLAVGQLTLRGSASWLDSSQQLGRDGNGTPLAGTLFNPAKINGRFGLIWSEGGWIASMFANYTGGVKNLVKDESGGSITTFDATLRYATRQSAGVLSGVEVALSARNLLDRDPPMYTPTTRIYQTPYDPTNYSAIGRFLSVSVLKHW